MREKILFAIGGACTGAFAMYGWLTLMPGAVGVRSVREASVFSSGPIQVWYQSMGDNGEFVNEFRFRKLCGDALIPCTEWSLGASTKSDRSYPTKDIEFHTAGEKFLMSFPDGKTIKGSLTEPWTVEGQ